MATRTLRGRLMLLYAVPFLLSAAVLLCVLILQVNTTLSARVGSDPDLEPIPEVDLGPVLTASTLGLVAMAFVSLALGWLIAGRYLGPLRAITATAREISASNLHRRLGSTGNNDEFTELAKTLDDLFARLQASFDSQRHFVANASHELRTPLTAERALLQVALADPDASAGTLRSACREVLALNVAQERLIDSLLTLASGEQGVERQEPFDLAEIARAVVLVRGQETERRGIHVETALSAAPAVGDPNLVESLVANLVDNALRHNVSGGTVTLVTTTTEGRATIAVRNTGPIVAPDDVERAFQPFQRISQERVRRVGDGYGLGLAIVHAIATAHGATLRTRALPDGGLDIEVRFSAWADPATGSDPVELHGSPG